jgi:hypothetical protein
VTKPASAGFFSGSLVSALQRVAFTLQRGTPPHTSTLAYAQVLHVMHPGFDDEVFPDWLSVWPGLFQSNTC